MTITMKRRLTLVAILTVVLAVLGGLVTTTSFSGHEHAAPTEVITLDTGETVELGAHVEDVPAAAADAHYGIPAILECTHGVHYWNGGLANRWRVEFVQEVVIDGLKWHLTRHVPADSATRWRFGGSHLYSSNGACHR